MEVADKSLEEHMDYLARSYDIWEGFSRWFANDADCQVPFRDILNGLQYLHGLDIVHKNLKPSNGTSSRNLTDCGLVLLKRGQNGNFQIKISDFSFVSGGAQSNIPYSAPEILPPHSEYSPKSDIWAYVCIVYEWELCCFDRRKAFPTDTAIKAFIFSGANPPHISWESLGVNRAAIPMGVRSREEEILGSWEVPNAEFRLCFKRDVGERPDVGELIDTLNGWYDKRRVDI
jgi:serine/threonine protein kinase